jgi:hypothetical protein
LEGNFVQELIYFANNIIQFFSNPPKTNKKTLTKRLETFPINKILSNSNKKLLQTSKSLQIYFENLQIHDVTFNLSVNLSFDEKIETAANQLVKKNFFLSLGLMGLNLTAAMTKFDNCLMTFTTYSISQKCVTDDEMIFSMLTHYGLQASMQLYSVLGSFEALGNYSMHVIQ